MKVNTYVKGAVRQFAYWFAHGTIDNPILNDIDYISDLKEESSYAETAFLNSKNGKQRRRLLAKTHGMDKFIC